MNFIDDNVISKCHLISELQPKVSPTPAHICLVISMSFQLYISVKGGHKRKYTAYTFSKTLERCTETTLSKNKHFSDDLEHAGLYVGFCLTEQTRWLLFECTMSTWTLNPDASKSSMARLLKHITQFLTLKKNQTTLHFSHPKYCERNEFPALKRCQTSQKCFWLTHPKMS